MLTSNPHVTTVISCHSCLG